MRTKRRLENSLNKRYVRELSNFNEPSYVELCIVVDNQVSETYDHDFERIQSFLVETVNYMNLVKSPVHPANIPL